MSQIYDRFKDEDGFLYITYSGENTFGACANWWTQKTTTKILLSIKRNATEHNWIQIKTNKQKMKTKIIYKQINKKKKPWSTMSATKRHSSWCQSSQQTLTFFRRQLITKHNCMSTSLNYLFIIKWKEKKRKENCFLKTLDWSSRTTAFGRPPPRKAQCAISINASMSSNSPSIRARRVTRTAVSFNTS